MSTRIASRVRTSRPKKNYRRAQAASDARLELGFEEKAREGQPSTWDYLKSVVHQTQLVHKKGPGYDDTRKESENDSFVSIPAYLQHVQRPGFIQPHGSLLLLERTTLKILALAENIFDFLDPNFEGEEAFNVLEKNVHDYFSPQSIKAIEHALQYSDLSLANPVSVQTAKTYRKLYAILHAIDEGIVMDLEPLWGDEAIGGDVIAIDKHSRVSASIGKLQSLPTNDVKALCDTLVKEVKALTGYDRIMVYKFHEDQHGEVIAEAKEDCLPPLIGLHYPANDVPQANRQLFVDVRLRIISNTEAGNVNIIQSPSLSVPISLSRSTMRGVASCHKEYCKNMGCKGTLVMAVVVNVEPIRSPFLWGLVCCHHHSEPRVIPYPQRYACDFLIQAFALQLSMEIEAAEDSREKRVMQMQAVLCGLLTRDAPLGLIRQSPNIKDLVPSDGAILLHGDKSWSLGITPTEDQVIDIANWLEEMDHESLQKGVFFTESLEDAGYPNAQQLAPAVCGLAATQVSTNRDFLMWFRSGFSKQITWAGHKDLHNVKEGVAMHPRRSFDAFLEVARLRSSPFLDAEINAMQGLKLIVQDSLPGPSPNELRLRIQTQLNAERLAIQNQLVEVARSLKVEMETAKTPIIGLSGIGVVCEWNNKAAELTGRSKEEVIGKSFVAELLAVESYEEFNHVMDLVGDGEELEPLEVCIRSRNASDNSLTQKVYLIASLYAHHDSYGNLLGIRIVGQDITPLKILSGEYLVSQEEASSLLNSSEMLVFAIDEEGRVSEWNLAMERISGMKKDNVFGKKLVGEVLSNSPLLVVPEPDSLVLFEVALCNALRGNDSKNHELHFQTWDGKQMDTLMHIIGRKGENGEVTGATCFMQDLMQRRAAENASAVRMVAEAASQAKTMQLACLCHEIRNPLNGILSSISFMEDTEMTSEQRELVITTSSCGKYLRRIVDDVLDLSKIEEGKLEIDSDSFSLMHVVDAVVAQEASNAYDKGLQLYCVTDPACIDVKVLGDGLRVQQIAANFCRNAIEYTDKGWVEIILKAMPAQQEENLRFVLSVSDSGKGLTPTQLESVFSMPETLAMDAEGEKQAFGGAGLGLVVCTKLASLMGGKVSCKSTEGIGSTFSLDLELQLADNFDDMANETLEGSLMSNRLKGVIYSIIGEWSTEKEIANADILCPTVSIMYPNLSTFVAPEPGQLLNYESMGDDGDEVSLGYDSATRFNERGGMEGEDVEERGSSSDDAFAALRDMEQAYGGRLAVHIVREVVDTNEVAVLVEIVEERTGEQVTALQQWGSAQRRSTLGEALREATRNAVISASQNLFRPQDSSGW